MPKKVVVLGGGIVGVCTALEAQKSGLEVVLIDRKTPGRETSFGNAGVLSESTVMVLNNPGLLKALPRLLKNTSIGFRYNPWFVLKNLGWFLKFLSYCTPRQTRHTAHALRALQVISLNRHKALIKEARVEALCYQGWLKIFRSEKSYTSFEKELAMMDEVGVSYTVYDKDEIRQLEPGLNPIYEKSVLLDNTCGVTNPAALTDAYMRLFLEAGGRVIEDELTSLTQTTRWHIGLKSGAELTAAQAVLTAGPWSAEIAAWLGYKIPMRWERGYHRHLEPSDGPALNRAIHDVDGGYLMAPMQTGVRITSGVEMTARDAVPNYVQIEAAMADAKKHHLMGKPVDDAPWMGCRPTLADSRPMIGKAPRHKALFFNFGHHHLGLSMAPGSGQIITALLHNVLPPIDISPFKATRFPI